VTEGIVEHNKKCKEQHKKTVVEKEWILLVILKLFEKGLYIKNGHQC
jgi:hypothetical protein